MTPESKPAGEPCEVCKGTGATLLMGKALVEEVPCPACVGSLRPPLRVRGPLLTVLQLHALSGELRRRAPIAYSDEAVRGLARHVIDCLGHGAPLELFNEWVAGAVREVHSRLPGGVPLHEANEAWRNPSYARSALAAHKRLNLQSVSRRLYAFEGLTILPLGTAVGQFAVRSLSYAYCLSARTYRGSEGAFELRLSRLMCGLRGVPLDDHLDILHTDDAVRFYLDKGGDGLVVEPGETVTFELKNLSDHRILHLDGVFLECWEALGL